MIVTVTLNPALDLTYTVDELVRHATHRVRSVTARPGGKGVNVARVLRAEGEPVLATGFLGGDTGERVGELLSAGGVPAEFVRVAQETRRTVVVVDAVDATGFWEPGPAVTLAEWAAFRARFDSLLRAARVVVLAGSLPAGLPPDAYATLIHAAHAQGVPTVLDAAGEALRHGLRAGPDVAKPNAHELAALAPSTMDVEAVLAAGARAVVVSYGRGGMLARTGTAGWRAAPPEVVAGNPTGAGDACAAALARGLRDGTPWPALLADAIALSAAAVAAPEAGAVDPATYGRLRPRVVVSAL